MTRQSFRDLAGSEVPDLKKWAKIWSWGLQTSWKWAKTLLNYLYSLIIACWGQLWSIWAKCDTSHIILMPLQSLRDLAGSEIPKLHKRARIDRECSKQARNELKQFKITLTVLSALPEASCEPSGLKVTDVTTFSWPVRVCVIWPEARFQTCRNEQDLIVSTPNKLKMS